MARTAVDAAVVARKRRRESSGLRMKSSLCARLDDAGSCQAIDRSRWPFRLSVSRLAGSLSQKRRTCQCDFRRGLSAYRPVGGPSWQRSCSSDPVQPQPAVPIWCKTMSNRPELSFGQVPSAIGGWAEAPRTPRSPVAPRGLNFDPDDRRRRIAQIEIMIAEMAHAADQLDREIEAEQVRAGIKQSDALCLSDLCEGGRRQAGQSQALDRAAQGVPVSATAAAVCNPE